MTASAPQSQPPRKPPRALFKYVLNPLMGCLLRSPWHHRVSETLLLLSFKGRKSGKAYSTPVAYHHQDEAYLLFTHSSWWKNMEGGTPVTMHLRGQAITGWAEAIRDPDLVLASLEPLLGLYGVRQARRLGLTLDPAHDPTSEELRGAIQAQGVIMIRLQPQDG